MLAERAAGSAEKFAERYLTPRVPRHPAWPAARVKLADGQAGGSIVSGRMVVQPKDGSCLFHSICFGLANKTSSADLRKAIATFIAAHPHEKIANTTVAEWVDMIAGQDAESYAELLSVSDAWGGELELAIATRILDISINVFEPSEPRGHFRCITSFGRLRKDPSGRTVSVVYHTEPVRHYDALLVDDIKTAQHRL